jgi:hypothetical protein
VCINHTLRKEITLCVLKSHFACWNYTRACKHYACYQNFTSSQTTPSNTIWKKYNCRPFIFFCFLAGGYYPHYLPPMDPHLGTAGHSAYFKKVRFTQNFQQNKIFSKTFLTKFKNLVTSSNAWIHFEVNFMSNFIKKKIQFLKLKILNTQIKKSVIF